MRFGTKMREGGDSGYVTRGEFLHALREMRDEWAERFEAIDKRFEAMDKRFEAMDKRFEAMDKRFEAMDKRMNERFEAMDKRMNERFEAMDKRFEAHMQWVSLVVGRLQTRVGKSLEETVAGALRLALSMYDITPDQVKLRQKISDEEGLIGPKGREYEFDILAKDGETYIFEVKSVPEKEDVLRFNDKAEMVVKKFKLRKRNKVLVTLAKEPDIVSLCNELKILLV